MKKILTTLMLSLASIFVMAQRGTVSGVVTDARTGETLVGATVVWMPTLRGTTSDINGLFTLSGIDVTEVQLHISYIGYETQDLKLQLPDQNKLFVEIKLNPSKVMLEEVTIVEQGTDVLGDREVEISQHRLTTKAIRSIPTARNDVFKAMKYLPGVESTEPFSPLVSVRGGDPGENLIMLDGVTMYNPYHFLSSSGTFNMQTVKEVDILAGGFGAEFGGRNSSVINISTRDGDQSGLHGEVKPTTSETKVFLEFPVGKKTTMMVAGRINYDLAGNFLLYSKNYFYDSNLSLTHRFNARNSITLKYFSSKDKTNLDFNSIYKYMGNSIDRFSTDSIDFGEIFSNMSIKYINQWRNNLATAIYKSVLTPKLFLRAQLSSSLHRADNYSELVMDVEDVVFNTSTKFKSKVNDYSAKVSFDYNMLYWSTLKFGAEYSGYYFSNQTELNKVESVAGYRKTSLVSLYAEDKLRFGKLLVRPGIRAAQFDNGNFLFEPRLNAVLQMPKNWRVQAAWGKYNQYIVSMNTQEFELNQFLDYYYPLTGKQPSQSTHYMMGLEKVYKNHTFSLDIYYKDISRTYTFDMMQSQYEAFALSDKIVAGSGKSYGAELMWKGSFGKVSGWGSYTLAKSTRSFPNIMKGEWFAYDYDRRHSLKGVLNYQATKRISYSAAFKAQSGAPRSVENIFQMYYMYEPLTGSMSYSPQYTVHKKNASRMPWLVYLDLGLEKKVVSGFGKDIARFFRADESYLTLNVYNVLFFRRNVLYYMPVQGWDKYIPMGDNYLPSVSAGYTIKF